MRIGQAIERVKKFAGACADFISQNPSLAEVESAELGSKLERLRDCAGTLCKNHEAESIDRAIDRG